MHDGMLLETGAGHWHAECVCGRRFPGSRLGAIAQWMSHWHDHNPDSPLAPQRQRLTN